jgi:hypothetical protein
VGCVMESWTVGNSISSRCVASSFRARCSNLLILMAELRMPGIALHRNCLWCWAAWLYCQMSKLLIADKAYSFQRAENALTSLMNGEFCYKKQPTRELRSETRIKHMSMSLDLCNDSCVDCIAVVSDRHLKL